MIRGLFHDLRLAARLTTRNPAVTLPVAATLALGIGATVTMFSIGHGLLRELPFEQPDRIVAIAPKDARLGTDELASAREVASLREQQTTFVDVAALRRGDFTLTDPGGEDGSVGRPQRLDGAEISPWAFDLLGAGVQIGRGFQLQDLEGDASPAVLLGDRLWRERYAADPDVLGRAVRVDGTLRTVIGVMPPRFGFPTLQHLWVPLDLETAARHQGRADGDDRGFDIFARLLPGVSLEQANAEMALITERMQMTAPPGERPTRLVVQPYTERFIGSDAGPLLFAMLAVVSLVLVIACANVSNVLLARSAGRGREMAVRTALGGGRARIVRQLLAETSWLATLGGLGGALLAWWAIDWFDRVLGQRIERFWVHFSLDRDALLFVAGLVLLATVLAGLTPALQTLRADLAASLRDAMGSVSSFRLARATRSLVIVEVALSCVLLVVAGVMARGVSSLADRRLGFDPEALVIGSVQLGTRAYPDGNALNAWAEKLRLEAPRHAELGTVGLIAGPPAVGLPARPLALDGEVYAAPAERPRAQVRRASPELLRMLGVTPSPSTDGEGAGRLLDGRDRADAVPAVVVNRAFVERVLGGGRAVGRRILLDGDEVQGIWREIVGVVEDGGIALREGRAEPGVLVPLAQAPARTLQVLATLPTNARHDPAAVAAAAAALRAAVAGVDPSMPIEELSSVAQMIDRELVPQRTFGVLFAVFAACGLALAAIGIYGVLAFSVSRRTREIGLRRALGAQTGQVLARTMRAVIWQLGVGLMLGMGLAMLVAPLLGELLFGADPHDPLVLAAVPSLLGLVALLAAALPAARASRVDPLSALRED